MVEPAAPTIDWPTIIAGLISALASLAAGAGLYFQNRATAAKVEVTAQKVDKTAEKVDVNTEITQKAADAAEQVQIATVDRLDYDRLRRMEAAVLTLDECQACRAKILELTDRRRTRRPIIEEPSQ